MVTRFELASQKGWFCYIFGYHAVVIYLFLKNYKIYPFIFGIIIKLYEYAICLQSFIDVAYTVVKIQLFEGGRPVVVQEAAPPV